MGTVHLMRRYEPAAESDITHRLRAARHDAAVQLQRADPARLPRVAHWTPTTVEAHQLGYLHGTAHGERCGLLAGRWQGAALVVALLCTAAAGGALLGTLMGVLQCLRFTLLG